MKIALVILHADPNRGGAERYTVDLAGALTRAGHDVSLVHCGSLPSHGLTRTGRYRRFLHSVDAHLAAERYDIVHAMLPIRRCDVYHPHAGMAAEAWRETDSVGRVFNPRRGAFARVERQLLGGGSPPIVLCLSEYVKGDVLKSYALPDDRLATLFNAVDLEHFIPSPQRPSRENVVALMVAQDFERKGLDVLLHAVKRLNDAKLKLIVVGKPDASPWKRRAEALGISDRIVFAGPTPDVLPFYHDADFFVLPTKHDPCSLVVLEALACGVPVISTRANGACETMVEDTHGIVLDDPNDEGALAEAMKTLMDVKTRERMRAACIWLRPDLSYEQHVRTLLAIYERATRGREQERAS